MNLVVSPITGFDHVELEEELSCSKIINLYQSEYNIDVSHYFKDLDFIHVYKCIDSGFRFYFPYVLAGNSDLYKALDHYPGYYGIRLEHQLVENIFQKGQKVLEVGCGAGFFLSHLQQKGLVCTGLEFNEDAIQTAVDKGLSVFRQDLIGYAENHQDQYDIVCSFQVLEHIADVSNFLKACIQALKIGGKLIVVVPNNNPFLYKFDKYHTLNLPPHHMGLWDEASLRSLTKFFPLKIDRLFVENLQKEDYAYYLKLRMENLETQFGIWASAIKFLVMNIRPHRLRNYLHKIICQNLPGRNVTVIYTKQ